MHCIAFHHFYSLIRLLMRSKAGERERDTCPGIAPSSSKHVLNQHTFAGLEGEKGREQERGREREEGPLICF